MGSQQGGRDEQAWSVWDVTALRKHAAAGDSIEEIANLLTRSNEAVLAKAIALGITLPQNSE